MPHIAAFFANNEYRTEEHPFVFQTLGCKARNKKENDDCILPSVYFSLPIRHISLNIPQAPAIRDCASNAKGVLIFITLQQANEYNFYILKYVDHLNVYILTIFE